MDFPHSQRLANRLDYLASTGSTNSDLIASAIAEPEKFPDFSVLVTGSQVAGRGRSGREWIAPAGSSLIVSILLRPASVSPTQYSWLPLIAGLSMANAVSSFGGANRTLVKWPNDILIDDRKVAGILSEALSDLSGVVVGTGLNVFQTREQLPIETASSLSIEGIEIPSLDLLLGEYLINLRRNYDEFISCNGELGDTELLDAIRSACGTIGRQVRVILPGDKEIVGEAIDIDSLGRLVVQHESQTTAVSVGDIVHLRHN